MDRDTDRETDRETLTLNTLTYLKIDRVDSFDVLAGVAFDCAYLATLTYPITINTMPTAAINCEIVRDNRFHA